jgi:YHS domain-containing protein
MTNDPVCGMRVDEESAEFQNGVRGEEILFLFRGLQGKV